MKPTATGLAARYLTALRLHLRRASGANGERARGFGHVALANGLASVDLARMHDAAVIALATSSDFVGSRTQALKRVGYFFTQALIPLEAAQRATVETNRLLLQRNKTLQRHTAALARVNHRLESEIARRKNGERVIRNGKEQYRELFFESQIMEKKLRQLTRQIIQAQEEERKEISRELHDEVVQTLVGINVELSALGAGASTSGRTLKARIARTQRLVEHSVKAVHRFARELRPAVLDDLGLIPALHAYSRSLAERKKIRIQLTAFAGAETLAPAERTVLFRVAQEALTNVVRHADATLVRLTITEIPGAVRMDISDDGKSFSVDRAFLAKNQKRLGLIGMKERLGIVGGSLRIESAPQRGTIVRAEIPFHPVKIKK
jgi:two-component system sensor histidine kinase DegS